MDFILEAEGRLLPVEVKATPRPTPQDARGLLAFLAEYLEAPGRLLLHGGEESSPSWTEWWPRRGGWWSELVWIPPETKYNPTSSPSLFQPLSS